MPKPQLRIVTVPVMKNSTETQNKLLLINVASYLHLTKQMKEDQKINTYFSLEKNKQKKPTTNQQQQTLTKLTVLINFILANAEMDPF